MNATLTTIGHEKGHPRTVQGRHTPSKSILDMHGEKTSRLLNPTPLRRTSENKTESCHIDFDLYQAAPLTGC
jgi:hypothetical protein